MPSFRNIFKRRKDSRGSSQHVLPPVSTLPTVHRELGTPHQQQSGGHHHQPYSQRGSVVAVGNSSGMSPYYSSDIGVVGATASAASAAGARTERRESCVSGHSAAGTSHTSATEIGQTILAGLDEIHRAIDRVADAGRLSGDVADSMHKSYAAQTHALLHRPSLADVDAASVARHASEMTGLARDIAATSNHVAGLGFGPGEVDMLDYLWRFVRADQNSCRQRRSRPVEERLSAFKGPLNDWSCSSSSSSLNLSRITARPMATDEKARPQPRRLQQQRSPVESMDERV